MDLCFIPSIRVQLVRKPTWTPLSNKNILFWDATDVSQIGLETCYLFYCVRHPERFMNTPQRNLAEALRSKQNFTWKTLMTFITPGVWSQDKPLAPSAPPASECCQQKTGRDGGCTGEEEGWSAPTVLPGLSGAAGTMLLWLLHPSCCFCSLAASSAISHLLKSKPQERNSSVSFLPEAVVLHWTLP